ncbi:Transposase family tnp2 [Rhizoctonia solani]|uniref:Transposase family tnp2 n=1 Tax=Rhizoctonia solani TaxID=456999 RepID=A0A8H7LNH9_9AGAM|nr:Transposase family tnp2 [Rhizoctonia solani]
MIEKLCYCSLCHAYTQKLGDFFGSAHYQSLWNIQPSPDSPYRLFDNFQDLALGFALDGFSLFKRRRKGNSTAWPLILVNYNLAPSIRTHLENVICVGVIPGPKQFKDLNSFLIPLLEELLELKIGVPTKDCSAVPLQQWFKLRAFLVLAFGDIPALSKLLGVKGHNAFVPCRGEDYWDIEDLPMRTPELFESHLAEIEASSTKTAREKLARVYGVNSRYLDEGSGNYSLTHIWGTIGAETAAALKFIPAQFVGTIHNIDQDISLYKAKGYSFWMLYLAPILLKGRLPSKYYQHVLDLCEIIELCLRYSIKQAQIDYLEEKIQNWVADYEAYYYQYKETRLSACPLTIHALLHVPYYIRQTGPVWTSWAFVMERFCGSLLPAIKNWLNPYPCINNYVQRRAQLQNISAMYNVRTIQPHDSRGSTYGDQEEMSKWEEVYPKFPASILGTPIHRKYPLNNQLFNQLLQYFCLYLTPTPTRSTFQAMIDIESVTQYGRVRIAGGGDRFRVAKSDSNPWDRDNTFVRFIMYPDANASFRNRADRPVRQVNYGQLLDIIYLKLKPNEHYPNVDLEYLLAHILPCETFTHDDATSTLVEYQKMAGHSIAVHLNSVEAVVGRAKRDDTWGIIDRSNGAVRTLFTNDNNQPGEEL